MSATAYVSLFHCVVLRACVARVLLNVVRLQRGIVMRESGCVKFRRGTSKAFGGWSKPSLVTPSILLGDKCVAVMGSRFPLACLEVFLTPPSTTQARCGEPGQADPPWGIPCARIV